MQDCRRPRLGIIGTGAIGGFYGLMLARAGFEVHFLLRSEYAVVVEHGLHVNSAVHGKLQLARLHAWQRSEQMPACEWLLVGSKTTSNAELAPLIVQVAAPGARVVLLQNGLAVEERLRPLLPDSLHLLGGLCFICVNRAAPGVIEHQALGAVNLGYHSGRGAAPGDCRGGRRAVPRGRPGVHGHAQPAAGALAEAGVERAVQRPLGTAQCRHQPFDGPSRVAP